MLNSIVCPISIERIDSNVSRLAVFLNVVLMVVFMFTLQPIYIYIVAIDCFIRAALDVKFSPIRWISLGIINGLHLKKKPIDLAQKIFASRLGFLCAFTSSILFACNQTTASVYVAGFLMILSTLDSVFNVCVGCLIYNYIVYPFYKDKL